MKHIKPVKPPFKLPVNVTDKVFLLANDCELICRVDEATKKEKDYMVNAINSHAALLLALQKCAWFMENVSDDTPNRTDLFFECREAWRDAFAKVQ